MRDQWDSQEKKTVKIGLQEILEDAEYEKMYGISQGDIIFLTGAGLSVPAGISSLKDMGKLFLRRIKKKNNLIKELRKLERLKGKNIQFNEEGFDLEDLMAMLEWVKAGDKIAPDTTSHSIEDCEELRWYIMEVVRECTFLTIPEEAIYLNHLLDISDWLDGIDIFTTNYDTTLETRCELDGVRYTDGFQPQWNKDSFDLGNDNLRLLKLHGSVLWYSSGRREYRVPVRIRKVRTGKNIDPVFTNEPLTELILYPGFGKFEPQKVYVELQDLFMNRLKNAKLLVVLGYRFRDEEIKNAIQRALGENPDLWMLVATRGVKNAMQYLNIKEGEERIIWKKVDAKSYLMSETLKSDIEKLWTCQAKWQESKKHLGGFDFGDYTMKMRLSCIGWPIERWVSSNDKNFVKRMIEQPWGKYSHDNWEYKEEITRVIWVQHIREIELFGRPTNSLLMYGRIWQQILFKEKNAQYIDDIIRNAESEWKELYGHSIDNREMGEDIKKYWPNLKQGKVYLKSKEAVRDVYSILRFEKDIRKYGGYSPNDVIIWKYKPRHPDLEEEWLNITQFKKSGGTRKFQGRKKTVEEWKEIIRDKMIINAINRFILTMEKLNKTNI